MFTRTSQVCDTLDGLMNLTSTDLGEGLRKIDLCGRLDLEGASAIELEFTALTTAAQTYSIVDLAQVEFLASIGIATLIRNARAARLRRGNMVLLNPRPNVASVLTTMRINQMIPLCYSIDEARVRVLASPPTVT